MFDIGPTELLLIVVVAVIVIGPKDLPLALRTACAFSLSQIVVPSAQRTSEIAFSRRPSACNFRSSYCRLPDAT